MRRTLTHSAIDIELGGEHVSLDLSHARLVDSKQGTRGRPITDVRAALNSAVEKPDGFPPLRAALTPDDHVAIALDPGLPDLDELANGLLDYLASASVPAGAVTVLLPPGASSDAVAWRGPVNRPKIEVHDPTDRRRLSYLATTKHGRRVYLNRTAVDADQLIVLGRCSYDPLLGYGGVEGAIYPGLADEEARRDAQGHVSMATPGGKAWPLKRAAAEVSWLLGTPFMLTAIEGPGDTLAHLLGGTVDSGGRAEALLDQCWRTEVAEPADTVIAAVGGNAHADFDGLARAVTCAARVVKPGGRIVVLSHAAPELGPAAQMLLGADEPARALDRLKKETPDGAAAAHLWARATQRASVYLLSGLPSETAEGLFTTPLDTASQASRVVKAGDSVLVISDADKALAILAPQDRG